MKSEIRFLNTEEELKDVFYNERFFNELQALTKEFQDKIETYGKSLNLKLESLVYFKLINGGSR